MNIQTIILSFLFILPVAFAQADIEATVGILRGLLGNLPSACSDITSSVCIHCLGYVKLLPLAFFFGVFYLILSYGIRYFLKGAAPRAVPGIQVGIILISIALAFLTLQVGAIGGALSRISSFVDWIGGLIWLMGITVLALFASRILNAVLHTQAGANPVTMLSILGTLLVLMGFLWGNFASFAGGLSGWFIVILIGILIAMFASSFFHGAAGNLAGIVLSFLWFLMFAVLRGDIGSGFLPELLGESKFDLGICM